MKRLEKQLKALQDHLASLGARAEKARGQTRRRLKRLERRRRVTVERTVRVLEPKVRQAVAEAAVIARGVRVDVRAGVAASRGSAQALTLSLLQSRAFARGFRRLFAEFTDRETSRAGLSWTALTAGLAPLGWLAQPPDREAAVRRAPVAGRAEGGGVHCSDARLTSPAHTPLSEGEAR